MSVEFKMIAEPTDGLTFGSDVWLGPGDDAAVPVPRGDIVITIDALVESVHFRRAWSSAFQTSRKVVAVNASDIETMGAEPSAVVIGLVFPRNLDWRWVNGFQEGVVEERARAGVSFVGDGLSSSAHAALGMTALGNLSERPAVTRVGAKTGDQVAARGRLGCLAGGLLVLQQRFGSPKDPALEQQCPIAPYGQGKVAAEAGTTTMIDVSGGLLQDLGHIRELSRVGIGVGTGILKIRDSLACLVTAMGKGPLGFVLVGDENHALAAALPAEAELPQSWLRISTVTADAEVITDDTPWTGGAGWDHFA